jgi:hypothetical protein
MDRVDKLERKLTHKEDELGMLQVTTTNTPSPEPGNTETLYHKLQTPHPKS